MRGKDGKKTTRNTDGNDAKRNKAVAIEASSTQPTCISQNYREEVTDTAGQIANLTGFRESLHLDGVRHKDNAVDRGKVIAPQATRGGVAAEICETARGFKSGKWYRRTNCQPMCFRREFV